MAGLAFTCACLAAEESAPEVLFKSKILFFGPSEAMRAYEGNWRGSQTVSVLGGAKVSSFELLQSYSKSGDRLECTARVDSRGREVEVKSVMFVQDGDLILQQLDADGKVTDTYRGSVSIDSVVWTPEHLVLLFDGMRDRFYYDADILCMESTGHKQIQMRDGYVFFKVESAFRKIPSAGKKAGPVLTKDYFKKGK